MMLKSKVAPPRPNFLFEGHLAKKASLYEVTKTVQCITLYNRLTDSYKTLSTC